jgi:coenzyme PQQ precursor peptide PqqA
MAVELRLAPPIISPSNLEREEIPMAWTTPTLVEICIGLEINGYLPAEF